MLLHAARCCACPPPLPKAAGAGAERQWPSCPLVVCWTSGLAACKTPGLALLGHQALLYVRHQALLSVGHQAWLSVGHQAVCK